MIKFIAIFILVVCALRFELIFRFRVSLNVYDANLGFVLHLFSIRIFQFRIIHESNDNGSGIFHLQVFGKQIEINLFSEETKKKILNPTPLSVARDILQELMIVDLATHVKIGDTNALRATMLMGSTKIFYCSLLSFLRSQRSVNSYESFVPYYNENIFQIEINGILRISFADIIFIIAIVVSKYRHRKLEKIIKAKKESI